MRIDTRNTEVGADTVLSWRRWLCLVVRQWFSRRRVRRHKHQWETTHTNSWMIPTRQVCSCGMSRDADINAGQAAGVPLVYCWVYSDGHVSEPHAYGSGMDD